MKQTKVQRKGLKMKQKVSRSILLMFTLMLALSATAAFASTPAIPDVTLDYDLANVATGIGNWFSSFWLILAFAVAIPVAFVIGRNVKDLFA